MNNRELAIEIKLQIAEVICRRFDRNIDSVVIGEITIPCPASWA